MSIFGSRTRRDRFADWAVLLLVLISLLLGLAVRAVVLAQSTQYAAATGVTVRYPEGWLRKDVEGTVLHVRNPEAGGFPTTFEVRSFPISAGGSPTATLTTVLTNVSLTRAQRATAYRVLEIAQGDDVRGMPTMQQTFGYVAENYDPFAQRLPVVVEGLDVAIARGEQAVVFTLLAEEDAFERAQTGFWRFVRSAQFD